MTGMLFAFNKLNNKNKVCFMKRLLTFLVIAIVLVACGGQIKKPLVEHKKPTVTVPVSENLFPPLLEMLTLGIVSDKEDDIKAARQQHLQEKYVSDENDARGVLKKSLGFLTLGLFGGKETKKQYEARLKMEAELKTTLVSDADDERGLVAHTFNTLTLGALGQKETKIERYNRLEKEAKLKAQLDQRGLAMKSIEVFSFGVLAPSKPDPIYSERAIMQDPKLGLLEYDVSTYSDAVRLLDRPIKIVTHVDGMKVAIFKVYEETYKHIPYIGTPQQDVHLHFNQDNFLVKPQ
ncbi:MAG: hypothetical protein ACI9TY_000288 [Alphaproteobacteria bacterium]